MTQATAPESVAHSSNFPESSRTVELRQLYKVFHGETVVNGVNLTVGQGEFFCILGPSGCGKTTILRMIAGFETPSGGEVRIQGQPMNRVPAYRRPVNTVFQGYALFNHLTVAENIAFGLRLKKLPRAEIQQRVQGALTSVRMEKFAQRRPAQLSGGQQQRVALARALVNRPAVVLLDEPLGALDLKLRKEMQVELSRLHQELGTTFMMVTHDQEEALSLSDRIAVIQSGNIEQVGTPSEIYEQPKTAFVADFIGDTNLFRGSIVQHNAPGIKVVTEQGLSVVSESLVDEPQTPLTLSIRPENIVLTPNPRENCPNCYPGQVKHIMYLGTHIQAVVQLNATGELLRVKQPNTEESLATDTTVYVSWTAKDCLALVD
ncbi:ABC transporter ATP-binding protein [Spirulina sp. CS-785/01]|uniref:ABC transporter ATP-binding protein n=1 Tax=Spirulina sp. CS-785/01 TaxID=3021716 RepID=UPI002330E7E8|nr:ABC transporter ATP-binding protein [Spirulina sp. CS-785/01]MDB9313661.1 ABC transporter ATP-binding protein [Spirulina sp. CS-785/01]